MVSPFPCCPVNSECHVKENPDRKKADILMIQEKTASNS